MPSPIESLRPGLITGIGSLPGADVPSSMALIAAHSPHLPFAPQWPVLGAGMIEQIVGPELRGDDGELRDPELLDDPPHPPGEGVDALIAAAHAGRFPDALALKVQLVGPLTLASLIRWRGRPALEDPGVLALMGRRVANAAHEMVRRLAAAGHPVILLLDEPMLGVLPAPQRELGVRVLGSVLDTLRRAGAITGVHCCSAIPWDSLQTLDIDILSFDPEQEPGALLSASPARELSARIWLAWGLVPTLSAPASAEHIYDQWRDALAPGLDPHDLARRAIVTASCGLAGLPTDRVAPNFALATAVARRLATLASGQDP